MGMIAKSLTLLFAWVIFFPIADFSIARTLYGTMDFAAIRNYAPDTSNPREPDRELLAAYYRAKALSYASMIIIYG